MNRMTNVMAAGQVRPLRMLEILARTPSMIMENALLEVVTLCSVAADRASAAFAWQTFAGRIPHVVASSPLVCFRVVLMMM